jgi:hypothetical protein
MDPRNVVLGVILDDRTANTRAALVLRDSEAVWKFSFDQVAGHSDTPMTAENSGAKNHAAQTMKSNRQSYLN